MTGFLPFPDTAQLRAHHARFERPLDRRRDCIDAELRVEISEVVAGPGVGATGVRHYGFIQIRGADRTEFGQQLDKGAMRLAPVRLGLIRRDRQEREFLLQLCRCSAKTVKGDNVIGPVRLPLQHPDHRYRREGEDNQQHERRDPETLPQIVPCHNPVHHRKSRSCPFGTARTK